jgi:hypothetical protein
MPARKLIVSSTVLIGSAALVGAYCDSFATVEQEFKTSAVVFVGKVSSAREVSVQSQAVSGGTFYSVAVEQVLKGTPSKTVELYSENSSGRFPMRVGVQYLVFAGYGVFEGISGQRLAINSCGNSAPLSKAHKALATVRKLTKV